VYMFSCIGGLLRSTYFKAAFSRFDFGLVYLVFSVCSRKSRELLLILLKFNYLILQKSLLASFATRIGHFSPRVQQESVYRIISTPLDGGERKGPSLLTLLQTIEFKLFRGFLHQPLNLLLDENLILT